ncbi:MAG: SwmB domain-containing protein, partial [Chlorobium sp.]
MAITRIFIDSSVNDRDLLISQLAPGTEYSVLDASRDGIEQMVSALAGQGVCDSLQIISHGAPGTIIIGSTVLNNCNFGVCAAELAVIGGALTESDDLLLYGTTSEDTPLEITFADLAAQGNESDVDGAESLTAVQATVSVTPVNNAPVISCSSFAAKVDYATGFGPNSVTSADVNGDAMPDLIVANGASNTVSVLMNSGNGTFAAKVDYATGPGPISVTSPDVNGDARLDLIVANLESSTVSVLMNSGNGMFVAKVDYSTGSSWPWSVTSADVNGDARLDLIVANLDSSTVSVLMNNGNGTFAAKVDYATGTWPWSVTSADVNGDARLDLIVANCFSDTVSVLMNNGNGTFAAKVDYASGSMPYSVTTADVNGDARPDLIVANGESDTVSVLVNKGNGTFTAKVDYATGTSPYSVTSADLNGDARLDLIVANNFNATVSVLMNNGNGTFAAKVDYMTGTAPNSVTSADVNGDAMPDLIVANMNSDTVSVLINAEGGISFTEQMPVKVASNLVINDPDGDASWNGGKLKVQITQNAETADRLNLPTANPGGNGVWLDTISGSNLKAGTAVIGVADAASASNGTAWSFTFNANATNELVQSVAQALTFNNGSDAPGVADRSISITVTDNGGASASTVQTVTVKAVNDIPTLTAFSGTVDTTREDMPVEITFAELAAQGNESDVDGIVNAFVVKSVSSGSLRIGLDAVSASAYDAVTNNTINAPRKAWWTPALNAVGTLNAFTAVARDNTLAESLTAVQATVSVTPDTTAPVFASATANSRTLVLNYTELNILDATNTPEATAFAVTGSSSGAHTISAVAVNASLKTVTLTLSTAVANGESVTVTYYNPSSGNDVYAIQDATGNDAATITAQPVTNNTPDTTGPVFASATVNGSTLVLSYTDLNTLDAINIPAVTAFAVSGASTGAHTVSAVAVNASLKTVTLTLSTAVANGESVTVTYYNPSSGNDVYAIQDATGNDAATITAKPVTNSTDTIAPVFASATVNGRTLVLSYTDLKTLDATNTPEATAFAVSGASTGAHTISAVAVNASLKTVTLTLSTAVANGESVTVTYYNPSSGNDVYAIQDATGNDAATITAQPVTNNTPDTTGPVFASATVNGSTLVLSYTDLNTLDAINIPAVTAFAVSGASTGAHTVSAVAVNASLKTVTLTLSTAVANGESVTVTYYNPSSGNDVYAIQDATGNDAATITAKPVTNSTDTIAPVFASATVNGRTLVLSYTDLKTLDATNTPEATAFAVSGASTGAHTISAVAVNASLKTVTLTLSTAVANGESVTVTYYNPSSGNDVYAIQDATGNDAATITAQPVTNNTPDTTGPVFASATVNGSTLVLSYTDLNTLDAINIPAVTAFAVSGASTGAHTVSAVAVNASLKTVTLTLSTAVANGESVTVTYYNPSSGNDVYAIQDATGNDAATITAKPVTNTTQPVTVAKLNALPTLNTIQTVVDVTSTNHAPVIDAKATNDVVISITAPNHAPVVDATDITGAVTDL